jgi:2-dehydro-3-deoxygluconokinase
MFWTACVGVTAFKTMIKDVIEQFPNLKMVATTLRNAKSAGFNDWAAIPYADGVFHESRLRPDLEIYDRVGGEDGFATGMIWAILDGRDVSEAVEVGQAQAGRLKR